MGINKATMQFKEELIALVNHSGLPLCNVELVMTGVLASVIELRNKAIEAEETASKAEKVEVKPSE